LRQPLSTVGHLLQSGIDLQVADAFSAISDASNNAAKAITRKRSLGTTIGMVPFRSVFRIGIPTELDALS
jgi:hypothetical protein